MKIFLCLMILAFSTQLGLAQESKPLTFKGVPMGGPIDEFIYKMKDNGLEHINTEDQRLNIMSIMYGDFAGFSNCWLYILPINGKVCSATINFPEYKNWQSLQIIYEGLQKSLITKYGEPTEVIEEFRTDQPPMTDSMRMVALRTDKCCYSTTFNIGQQSITLSIDNFKNDNVCKNYISLRYMTLIPVQINDFNLNTDSISATWNIQ